MLGAAPVLPAAVVIDEAFGPGAEKSANEELRAYVRSVLSSEMVLVRDRITVERWRLGPTVGIVGTNEALVAVVEGALAEVNRIVAPSGVVFDRATDTEARVTFVVAPRAKWAEHAAGAEVFGLAPDGQSVVRRGGVERGGWVFVNADLPFAEARSVILRETLRLAGIPNNNPFDPESVLKGSFAGLSIDDFSEWDRKLLRFLYVVLESGEYPSEFRLAYAWYWDRLE